MLRTIDLHDGMLEDGKPFWVARNGAPIRVLDARIYQQGAARAEAVIGGDDGIAHNPWECSLTRVACLARLRKDLDRRENAARGELAKVQQARSRLARHEEPAGAEEPVNGSHPAPAHF